MIAEGSKNVELIQHDIAQRHSDMVESNSLVVVREMMAEEIRQAHAQLRRSLRDDREAEAEQHREWMQKQIDRLAGLAVMAIRNAGIARRLVSAIEGMPLGKMWVKDSFSIAPSTLRFLLC
jgi:hypothetical protein